MPTCTVCRHPARKEADRALLAGEPVRDVAGRLGLSKTAVGRHKLEDLPPRLVEAKATRDLASAEELSANLADLVKEAQRLGKKAEAAGDVRAALLAVRELVRIQELTAKVAGALRPEGGGSVHLHFTADQGMRVAETYLARRKHRAIEATATGAAE